MTTQSIRWRWITSFLIGIVGGSVSALITSILISIFHVPDKLAFLIGFPLVIAIAILLPWLAQKFPLLLSEITVGILFSVGTLILLSAYRPAIWANIVWDIRVVALGASIIGISIGFWSLYSSLTYKEIVRNTDKTTSQLHESISKLESRVDAALQKYEKLTQKLTALQTEKRKRGRQAKPTTRRQAK